MNYVIKIGKNYIGYDKDGKYAEVSNINDAIQAPLHRLTNIVNNSISPTLRKNCKVVTTDSIKVTSVPVVTTATKKVTVFSGMSTFDSTLTKLKSADIVSFTHEYDALNKKLSTIDSEVSDIEHYIEFNKMNAAEGYKAFKMLQDKLLERRVIKDDYTKFQMLASAKVSDIFDGTLDEKLSALDSRKYTPRVLKELFKD